MANVMTYQYQNKSFQLTPTLLQDWLEHSPTQKDLKLNQFGIKSSIDVMAYLQSPKGKLAEALIKKYIQHKLAENALSKEQIQALLKKERRLAILILSLMNDEAAAKQYLSELSFEEYGKLVQNQNKKETYEKHLKTLHELEAMAQSYQEATEALENEYAHQTDEANQLNEEYLELERIDLLLLNEALLYQESFQHLFDFFDIPRNMEDIDEKIAEHTPKLDADLSALDHDIHNGNVPEEILVNRIQNADALRIQIQALHDFKAALAANHKLVHKDGKTYVLKPNQSFDNISKEEQEGAHQTYLQLKPKFEKTRLSLEKNQEIERETLAKKKLDIELRTKNLLNNLQNIERQHRIVKNIANEINLRLQPSTQNGPAPQPKPNSYTVTQQQLMNSTPSPQHSMRLKLALHQIKQLPTRPGQELSPNSVYHLMNINRRQLENQYDTLRQQRPIPGVPMQPILMQALMRYNGFVLQQQQAQSPQATVLRQETLQKTAPTPFDMKLKPSPY